MGSLSTCLKKTRAGLAPGDEDAIVNAAADLRDTGLKASEAAQKAVRDLLAQAIAARNELKPAPEPVAAPAAARNTSMNVSDKKYPATVMGSRLLAIVNKAGGLSPSLISEFSERVPTTKIDKKTGKLRMIWRNPMTPQGNLFRAGGTSGYSRLGELMEENGYLPPGSAATDYKAAGEAAKDMIKAALISRKEAQTQDDVLSDAQARRDAGRDAFEAEQASDADYAELDPEAAREAEAEREAIIAEAGAPVARIDDMADDDVPWDAAGTVGGDQDAAAFLGITIEEFQREQGRVQGAVRQDEPAQAGSGQGDPADAGRAARPPPEAGSAAARDRPAEEGLTLEAQTPADLQAKAEREQAAADRERKQRTVEQERLRKEAEGRDLKARADQTVDDFALGQSADQQMSGMGDMFGDAPAEEDPFAALFGTPAEQAAAQERATATAQAKTQDLKRVRDAIATEKKRAAAEHDDWAGRVYKANKTQVELSGDGPSKQGSMSIGAINESRRRNAMDALAQEMLALDKLADSVSTESGAERVLSNLRDMMAKAERAVESGNWPGMTVDSMFESMLLGDLNFRGPGGKGNITSNGLSKAVLAAIKTAPSEAAKPEPADGEAPQLSEAQARKQFEWRNLGQKDGTKTHGLFFYVNPEDKGTGRSMGRGQVTRYEGSNGWQVDSEGVKYPDLSDAKAAAIEAAIPVLREQGWIERQASPAEDAKPAPVEAAKPEPAPKSRKADAGKVALFSRATRSPKGVPAADLRRMVDALSASWKGLRARPEVVATAADLPPKIVDSLRSQNALGSTRGLRMSDGKVYLIADKLDSMSEAQAVLFHEVLGHEGLRAFLGDGYTEAMDTLRTANPELAKEANDWYAKFGRDAINDLVDRGAMTPEAALRFVRDHLAVEEALSDRAGQGPVPKGWKAVMAALQRALRAIKGLSGVADWLESKTEAETYAVLMGARRAIERGTGDLVERLMGAEPARSSENPVWMSALLAEVGKAPMKAGMPGAWTQYLDALVKRGAVKADEIEWTGLREFLALQQGKVTREQLGAFLADNGVRVTETVLGGRAPWLERLDMLETRGRANLSGAEREEMDQLREDRDEFGIDPRPEREQAKYSQYTLPGGTNYREVLLTLPFKEPTLDEVAQRKFGRVFKNLTLTEQKQIGDETFSKMNEAYRSGHWDQPNVLAHIRLNDRTDADGKRVLFVEEIQSDWGQAAKKYGLQDPDRKAAQAKWMDPGYWEVSDAAGRFVTNVTTETTEARAVAEANRRLAAEPQRTSQPNAVPRAPLIGKTDAWVALAIKRVISIAAREGYDRVAFVNGAQSAERYDLSKQVDSIDWFKADDGTFGVAANKGELTLINKNNLSAAGVEELVGKDVARKITESTEKTGALEGLDLKVGGAGMVAFYDRIVPAVAKDVLRKVGGGQMGAVQIERTTFGKQGRPSDWNVSDGVFSDQPGFDITPAMREKAAAGLPLFSRAPNILSDAFRRWFGKSVIANPDGTPKVMYHGTGADIRAFRGQQAGAIFLTDEPIFAQAYANASTKWLNDRGQSGGENILPVYVKAENPFDYDNPKHVDALVDRVFKQAPTYTQGDGDKALVLDGRQTLYTPDVLRYGLTEGQWSLIEMPEIQAAIKAAGHDSFYVNEDDFKNLAVYDPTQVKSAIGNKGTFDPTNPDITLSRKPAQGDRGAGQGGQAPLLSRTPPNEDPILTSAKRKAGLTGPRSLSQKLRAFYGKAMDAVHNRKSIGEDARQGMLDQFHGIRRAMNNEIGALPAEQDPYITARLANGGASSVMRALLLHGQAKWTANGQHLEKKPDTTGLLDILKPLGSDLNDWFGWMVGNRAARLMTEGRENSLTEPEILQLQGLANTPEKLAMFRRASMQYSAFKRSVLDVAQEAGLINPESRRVWDHADYIPFYREVDEKSLMSPTGRKGLAGQSSGIRTLKGGESALNDPMENLLMNFSRLIDASLKNNALRKTIDALGAAESDFVKKIGYDMTSAIVPRSQIIKELVDAGTPESIIATLPTEVFEGMAKLWAIKAPADPDVVRVMVGGKPQFYRVSDPLLLRSLTSFVPFTYPGQKALVGAKRLLTAMVTSTPEFMLRNWIRDSVAAQAITQTPFRPTESVKGIWKAYKESPAYEAMLFAGASFQSGNVNAGDPEATAIHMRRALRAKGMDAASVESFMGSIVDSTARGWERYREVGEAIENANREAVYEAAIKAGKTATQAAYDSKDLMDFSLRGDFALYQAAADVLPFLNARVQGLYRLGRSDPKRLVRVMLYLAAFTGLLMLYNSGEDWYERLADWDKDAYWHLMVFGHHFRIPKPFEIGVLAATLPERIARGFMGLDSGKKSLGRVWANVRDQLAFDPMPQLFRPAVDAWANKDSFRDRDIENMADEGKSPSARFDARTSDTMRVLADAAEPISDWSGLSPKKLEFLVNGYFGTIGMYALTAADYVVRELEGKPDRPTLRTDDLPIVRAFYAVEPGKSTVFESDLYKMRRELNEIVKEVRALETSNEEGSAAKAKAKREKEADKLKVRGVVEGAAKQLMFINKEISRIYTDPKMTPDAKRAKIDELMERKNTLAQKTARRPDVQEAF